MTYGELSYRATKLYTKGKITLDKYMEMTKPLNREIEQEPILDKMKAEIKALPRYGATSNRYLTVYVDVYEVLKIINKYRGET